jgi:hypothetical protein
MSAIGPKQTCSFAAHMSAFGGKQTSHVASMSHGVAGRGRQNSLRVPRVLHGDAGRFWKSLENNENKMQHMQHETPRDEKFERGISVCAVGTYPWLGN